MEPLRDERLHEETPHRATDCSDQTGCRLKDESTTPPYQRRPRTASGKFSGAVAVNHSIAFGAQEQSHGWGSRAWDRGGSDDSRLLRIAVTTSPPPERAQATEPALFS